MKTPNWKPQTICTQDGYTIVLSFEAEDTDARTHFTGEYPNCGWTEEQYEPIKNFYWFVAKVTAFKGSIEAGSAYLGGNAYSCLKEVLKGEGGLLGGYFPQLMKEAIEEANKALFNF